MGSSGMPELETVEDMECLGPVDDWHMLRSGPRQ